jgi:hypothetical protein
MINTDAVAAIPLRFLTRSLDSDHRVDGGRWGAPTTRSGRLPAWVRRTGCSSWDCDSPVIHSSRMLICHDKNRLRFHYVCIHSSQPMHRYHDPNWVGDCDSRTLLTAPAACAVEGCGYTATQRRYVSEHMARRPLRFRRVIIMIRTADEMNRNVGESQPLPWFLSWNISCSCSWALRLGAHSAFLLTSPSVPCATRTS